MSECWEYIFYETSGTWFVEDTASGYTIFYNNGRYIPGNKDDEVREHFETWEDMSRMERKRYKARYVNEVINKNMYATTDNFSMECFTVSECVPCAKTPYKSYATKASPVNCNKKEETMDTTARDQRRHLNERAYKLFYDKDYGLKKTFNLVDTPQPKTVGEFIDFIKEGKFTVEEKYLSTRISYLGHASDYIRFRDPKAKEDQAGYEAAKELLDKDFSALSDDIIILDPKEGLEKLRAFEAKSFH